MTQWVTFREAPSFAGEVSWYFCTYSWFLWLLHQKEIRLSEFSRKVFEFPLKPQYVSWWASSAKEWYLFLKSDRLFFKLPSTVYHKQQGFLCGRNILNFFILPSLFIIWRLLRFILWPLFGTWFSWDLGPALLQLLSCYWVFACDSVQST